ncbi:MAG: tetratricopeptide repeat protein [Planctomycetes bacterium]|nr:tetratricopeptide repeat protein [Planctomycetota bacterium]
MRHLDTDGALRELARAAEGEPWAEAHTKRGELLSYYFSDLEGGLTEITRAVDAAPHDALLRVHRVLALASLHRWAEAEAELSRARELSGETAPLAALQGTLLLQRGDHAGALDLLEEAARRHPDSVAIWHRLGKLLLGLGRGAEAARAFTRALELAGVSWPTLVMRGEAYLAAAPPDLERAGDDARAALALAPASRLALLLAIRVQEAAEPGSAREALDALVREFPGWAAPLEIRAAQRKNARDFEGALADAEQALRNERGAWLALVVRSRIRSERGDHRGAEGDASTALRLRPANPDALLARALARSALGELSEARADIELAAQLWPESRDVHMVAGNVAALLQDWPAALDRYGRAIALEATPHGLTARANVHLRLGDLAAARDDLDHALRLDPAFADALWLRANLRARDDAAGAVADLEAFLRHAPAGHPWRDGARGLLEGLRSRH